MNNWHWRDTMRPVRFFMFDARAALPFVLVLMHFRLYTLEFAAVVTCIFWLAERSGLTFWAALLRMRTFLIGPRRPAILKEKKRKIHDYGI